MLAGHVVQHQVNQHANAAPVRLRDEALEIVVGAVVALDAVVVRHVVAVIARRLGHRHEPDAAGAQVALRVRIAVVDVVELLDEAVQVADAVAVAVVERADEDLVADGAALPVGRVGNAHLLRGRPGGVRQECGAERSEERARHAHAV